MNRDSAASQQTNWKRFLGLLVLGIFFVAGIAVYAFPHCVPAEKLAGVRPGITRSDGVAFLGEPEY